MIKQYKIMFGKKNIWLQSCADVHWKSEAFMAKLSSCLLIFVDGRGRSKKPNGMIKWIKSSLFFGWSFDSLNPFGLNVYILPRKTKTSVKSPYFKQKVLFQNHGFLGSIRWFSGVLKSISTHGSGGLATFGGTHGWGGDCGFCTLPRDRDFFFVVRCNDANRISWSTKKDPKGSLDVV